MRELLPHVGRKWNSLRHPLDALLGAAIAGKLNSIDAWLAGSSAHRVEQLVGLSGKMRGAGKTDRVPDHQEHVVPLFGSWRGGRAKSPRQPSDQDVKYQAQPKSLVRLVAAERQERPGRIGQHHVWVGGRMALGILNPSQWDRPMFE